jgi:hypothetical protein
MLRASPMRLDKSVINVNNQLLIDLLLSIPVITRDGMGERLLVYL